MILARFILKVVGFRILAALAVLFAVLQVLDLLDATTDVLERGLGVGGVMRYAALRAPSLLIQAMPIAVLAAVLVGLTLPTGVGPASAIGPTTASWKSSTAGPSSACIRLRGMKSRCTSTPGCASAASIR